MKILQINKFFSVRGGSDTVFFETISGLRERGHEVSEFAMQNPNNARSDYAQYFVGSVSLHSKNIFEQWRATRRVFSSREVRKNLTALVCAAKPDVAHIHNAYRELSADTFLTLKKLGIPTVLTVHDMFPLVPNHSFMLGETMAEEKLNQPYKCLSTCCINNSLAQSFGGVLEAYYYRYKKIWQNIDAFICPSEFMKDKLLEYGFPAEKITVAMNPCDLPKNIAPLGDKIVFLGRLHVEKGIRVFMRAVKDLREFSVVVAGSGPEAEWVDDFIKENKLTHVERIGWVNASAREKHLATARVVVSPSIFYDLCSLTILEALAMGRLVVASDRGGNPELIKNGETGWLARPEDVADTQRAIREAMTASPQQTEKIISAGRELVKKNHDMKSYLDKVERIYRGACRVV